MKTNIILQGDALTKLKELPKESIDCVMTSPPYWALRDYGVEGQLGLEQTFAQYINNLCDIFDEVKRIIKKTGTCWINLGDTYVGGGGGNYGSGISSKQGNSHETNMKNRPEFIKANKIPSKCLTMIPERFAIEMINRGWILRNTIIWHKPNCMPSSVKDRFTVDFEKIFFFVKNKQYYFETQYESFINGSDVKYRKELRAGKRYDLKCPYEKNTPYAIQKRDKEFVEYRNLPDLKEFTKYINEARKWKKVTIDEIELRHKSQAPHHWFSAESFPSVEDYKWLKEVLTFGDYYDKQMIEVFTKSSEKTSSPEGRNKRTVWRINPKPFKEAHFAVYPEELCETPIRAGCPEFVCVKCGKARENIIETENKKRTRKTGEGQDSEIGTKGRAGEVIIKSERLSDCGCNADFTGGIVLDPFFGAGTTGLVALKQNKKFIGIELNQEYIEIARNRLRPHLEQTKLGSS